MLRLLLIAATLLLTSANGMAQTPLTLTLANGQLYTLTWTGPTPAPVVSTVLTSGTTYRLTGAASSINAPAEPNLPPPVVIGGIVPIAPVAPTPVPTPVSPIAPIAPVPIIITPTPSPVIVVPAQQQRGMFCGLFRRR